MDFLQTHSIPDWGVILMLLTMTAFMFVGGNMARKYGILDGAFNQSSPEVKKIIESRSWHTYTDTQLMREALSELAHAPSAKRNSMPEWYARHALILSKIAADLDENSGRGGCAHD